jgi:hypothetical protein
MKVSIKPGVVIKEFNSQLCHVCYSAWFVWKEYGLTATITSANDGKHMENSLHYKNLAWDLRIWGLPNPAEAADKLRNLLNAKRNDYDVIFGDANHLDHVHVEFDPKE